MTAGESRVLLRIHHQQRTSALHNLLNNGLRKAICGVAVFGAWPITKDGRQKSVAFARVRRRAKRFFGEQHGVTSFRAINLQNKIEHALRDIFYGGFVAQCPANLIEKSEQPVFALQIFDAAIGIDARVGPFQRRLHLRNTRAKLGWPLRALQEFRDTLLINDLRQMRCQFRRSLGDNRAGHHVLKTQLDIAKPNDVAVFQLRMLDAHAINQNAVRAALVGDNPDVLFPSSNA